MVRPLFESEALQGFLRAQRLAYDCALAVEEEIRPGWSEKDAAAALARGLERHGVRHCLHRPFAWFGERSRFQGCHTYRDFLPTDRKLSDGEVFILDISPIVDGYVSDIGYTSALNPHPDLERARAALGRLRRSLPNLIQSRGPAEVWASVERALEADGFDNCHARYPFSVLGHRVRRIRFPPLPEVTLPLGFLSWFPLTAQLSFASRGLLPDLFRKSSRRIRPGLWAIEPHLGGSGFGAKFEEILVVEPGRAYWLDHQVPQASY